MPFKKGVSGNPGGRGAVPFEQRFWSHVLKSDKCWVWTAHLSATTGYGNIRKSNSAPWILAHRAAYELLIGPIPEGHDVDHLCRNKWCVNPEHLEAVTPQENTRRWKATVTHCKHGHPFNEENTSFKYGGRNGRRYLQRRCLACHRLEKQAERERKAS